MIRMVAGQVLAGAGLALLRGPAGIGKTFALDEIEAEIVAAGDNVVRVTASPANGGSISAFTRAVLSQYRIETSSTSDGVEAMFDLLSAWPFRGYGPRTIFMADESQELKPAVVETIRVLWDRGTNARLGLSSGPAFGCLLVGNDLFMGKGGNIRVAGFRPLLTRVTHNIALPRPSQAEHAAFAALLFPDAPELQAIVAGFGVDAGNLRTQDVAARQSRLIAGDGPVTPDHLRRAIKMMGGK
ncbi:MAG: ATP-binding protein [Gemmobacter sp.]|jgi:type II secretory pathway predicted ATPase ExeA|nr:ATP-binding protein [Gemmobacter sp.]